MHRIEELVGSHERHEAVVGRGGRRIIIVALTGHRLGLLALQVVILVLFVDGVLRQVLGQQVEDGLLASGGADATSRLAAADPDVVRIRSMRVSATATATAAATGNKAVRIRVVGHAGREHVPIVRVVSVERFVGVVERRGSMMTDVRHLRRRRLAVVVLLLLLLVFAHSSPRLVLLLFVAQCVELLAPATLLAGLDALRVERILHRVGHGASALQVLVVPLGLVATCRRLLVLFGTLLLLLLLLLLVLGSALRVCALRGSNPAATVLHRAQQELNVLLGQLDRHVAIASLIAVTATATAAIAYHLKYLLDLGLLLAVERKVLLVATAACGGFVARVCRGLGELRLELVLLTLESQLVLARRHGHGRVGARLAAISRHVEHVRVVVVVVVCIVY